MSDGAYMCENIMRLNLPSYHLYAIAAIHAWNIFQFYPLAQPRRKEDLDHEVCKLNHVCYYSTLRKRKVAEPYNFLLRNIPLSSSGQRRSGCRVRHLIGLVAWETSTCPATRCCSLMCTPPYLGTQIWLCHFDMRDREHFVSVSPSAS